MNNITITHPTKNDIDTMFLWGTTHRELWSGEIDGWYRKKTFVAWAQADPESMFVAKDGETLVGMCLVEFLHGWVYCSDLYVDDPYRGKGIGKMLLDEVQTAAAKRGIEFVDLVVEENNEEAKSFYKKIGFHEGFHFIWMSRKKKNETT